MSRLQGHGFDFVGAREFPSAHDLDARTIVSQVSVLATKGAGSETAAGWAQFVTAKEKTVTLNVHDPEQEALSHQVCPSDSRLLPASAIYPVPAGPSRHYNRLPCKIL